MSARRRTGFSSRPRPGAWPADTGDLWDTGKVASARTTQVTYEGKPLQPMQAVFWKVRSWDAAGLASAWSEPSTWSAGLQDAKNWKAEWISGPLPETPAPIWTDRKWLDGGDQEKFPDAVRGFRARLEIPQDRPLRDVVLRFAADNGRGRVHVDGRFVLAPQRQGFVETVDLTGRLSPGPHVVAIAVASDEDPKRPAPYKPLTLVAEVVATPVDGDPVVIALGPATKTQAFQKQMPENWTAKDFDDGKWSSARARVRGTALGAFEQTLAPPTYVRTTFTVDRPVRRALLHGSAHGRLRAAPQRCEGWA